MTFRSALELAWSIAGEEVGMLACDGVAMPRPCDSVHTAAVVTEDEARAGGCCICPPNCAGTEPVLPDRPCDPLCDWCTTGCGAHDNCACVGLVHERTETR